MNEILTESVYFGLAAALGFYWLAVWIGTKIRSNLYNPLLVSCIFIIITLLLFNVDYKTFDNGAKYLTYLLTPTTVCLAVPMYKQLKILKENFVAIFVAILAGAVACAFTVLAMCIMLDLDSQLYRSLLPKSITTAIALGVSGEIGGIVSVTSLCVAISGLCGGILASAIFKVFNINDPVAQGLAIGNASHAVGTSRAFEIGEVQGAMSSLSIVVAGIMTVMIAPLMTTFM